MASRLLARRERERLMAIYGFARLVDDTGAEAEGGYARELTPEEQQRQRHRDDNQNDGLSAGRQIVESPGHERVLPYLSLPGGRTAMVDFPSFAGLAFSGGT